MLKHIPSMAASYWNVASWLVADIVRTLGFRLAGFAALAVAVILAKITTFGGFLLFFKSYLSPTPVVIPKIGIALPSPDPFFWAPGILAAGVVMGGLIYLEARWRVSLASRYALNAMHRTLGVFSSPYLELQSNQSLTQSFKVRTLASDSWAMLRAAMPLIGCILPIIQVIVATGILIAMSWQLAVLLFFMSILYVVPFAMLNRRLVKAARQRPESSAGFKSDVVAALTQIAYPQYRTLNSSRARELLFGKHLYEQIRTYRIIRTTRYAVTFLSSVFLALVMCLIIIYVSDNGSSGMLLSMAAYAIVLFHAYTAANAIATQVSTFNRFLPQFGRVVSVLMLEDTVDDISASPPRSFVFEIDVSTEDRLAGSEKRMTVGPGKICTVVQPQRLTIHTMPMWLSAVGLKPNKRARFFLVPSPTEIPNVTLQEIFHGAAEGAANNELDGILELPFARDAISGLPDGLDTHWEDACDALKPAALLALSVASALTWKANAIVIDRDVWERTEAGDRSALVSALPSMTWLVGVNAAGRIVSLPEDSDQIVIATDDGVIGLGDRTWAMDAIRANRSVFRNKRPAKNSAGATELGDEFDDDAL